MLPFLKNRHEASMSGPIESEIREPDSGEPSYEMLDAIVDDVMEALSRKDKGLLKSALEALVEHIQEKDELQDQTLNKEV